MDGYELHIEVKRRRCIEQRYFELSLIREGSRFKPPAFIGIYSSGRSSLRISGWIDGDYYEIISSDGVKMSLAESALDVKLFRTLGDLIPPGGSMMVAYGMIWGESDVHRDTIRALSLGIPPIATPIGYLLSYAGCWASFRDWYIPEGGNEGPKKLQGFKAIDQHDAKRRAEKAIRLLEEFIKKAPINRDLGQKARERAKEIMNLLSSYSQPDVDG
ncbi:MAG: DUF1122 family protein [Nitrososphaerales archaeon]|nr:DUF1122 family protein [Nitrososphaerales archaeon]